MIFQQSGILISEVSGEPVQPPYNIEAPNDSQ